jgi:5-(carboxyamino)imidazole ribonucleotide synthase
MGIDGVTPHIYGKRETRPFRKMGHVTVNEDMVEARKNWEEVKNKSNKLIEKLKIKD